MWQKYKHPLPPALLMLSALIVTACASSPVPVVARCPKPAEPPPGLMQPPQATNAQTELQQWLQTLADGANPTPEH